MDRLFTDDRGATRRHEVFFWVFSCVALFLFLGHNALWASEDRWAEIAREMVVTGNYWHPAINFEVYFDKPQLTYWLIVPFALLRGAFDEFVVRLPSALAGLAGLYGTLMLGKKLFDRGTALLGAWLLLTCYGFLFWARAAAADTANLAAIILAVAYFFQVEDQAKFRHYLVFYLICFLGALAKGLPALVMPLVVIAPHLLMHWRWKRHLKVSNFLAFFVAAAAYAAPFYFASKTQLADPLHLPAGEVLTGLELVWRENVVRVFNAFDHKDPFYSYLYNLPRILLPWTLLVGVAIAGMVKRWKQLPEVVRELMIGTLLMFVLFSLSTSRRWYYILPLLPFCTLLGAAGLQGLGVEKWNKPVMFLMRMLVIIAASLGVASLVAIPLLDRIFPFPVPVLLLAALPVAGVLSLLVMLLDNQPEKPVERLTGVPGRFGALALGGGILVAAVFDCILPSLTMYRTEKQLFQAFRDAELGIPAGRIFAWRNEISPKFLFYTNLTRPVADSPRGSFRKYIPEAEFEAMSREQRAEADYRKNLADLKAFLARNAGRQVAIFSLDRELDLELLSRAMAELKVPFDVKHPDFSEQMLELVRSDSRKWSIWVLRVPRDNQAH